MKIKLICIGKIKEKYLLAGIQEYVKRLGAFCKFERISIKESSLELEAQKLSKHLNENSYILDQMGKQYTSEDFAKLLKKQKDISFIIGSSNGILTELKDKRKNLISLSKMTFLHEMTELILMEQIYRGFMIINKRKYHK